MRGRAPRPSGGTELGGDLPREKPPQGLALLDGGAPRERAGPLRRGSAPPPLEVAAEGRVDLREDRAPLGRREDVEEGDPDEERVVAALRARRRGEPAGELPAAGGGDPVEEPRGAAAGPQRPEEDPAVPAEPGEGGIDLREAGAPGFIELEVDRARELVSCPRLGVEEAEEDVGKGHAETISR